MFRVLIADDENSVIQSMLCSVPWAELGIEVIGTAADSREALELAEKERTDIAIVDIRMPGLNGLELCEQLRAKNARMQLIIASGYAEFAYAEKAIQYGVLGYCLKPLDYAQITRYLRRAVHNLKQTDRGPDKGDLMERLERCDREDIWEYLRQMGFQRNTYYVAVSCGEEKLDYLEEDGVSLRLGRRLWGYIMKSCRAANMTDSSLGAWKALGYMEHTVEEQDIYDSLNECSARALQYFVDDNCRICCHLDESRANRWLAAAYKKIQQGQWDSLSDLLEKIDREAKTEFTVRSAQKLYNLVMSNPSLQNEENDTYIYSADQLVTDYGSFPEMIHQLRQSLDKKNGAHEPEIFSNASFMKLMQYINENYKGEISLAGAAKVLHMNANYVGQLFKRESGTTFVHYINQRRIEDAKELLVSTTKNLTDIGLAVGFNDTFHFIRTFKKYIGMTPGQYRTEN